MKRIKICTKQHPYNKHNPKHELYDWQHPQIEKVYTLDYGNGIRDDVYKCPICGTYFRVSAST